jgi:arylsulfatase A-like enzyme
MADEGTGWTRRRFLQATGAAAAASALPQHLRAGQAPGEPGEKPNILILQPDQYLGTVMSCAGDPNIHTPNLDALAAQGIRFTHAASCSPVCSPCRASYQTGLYAHTHGVVRNNIRLDLRHRCMGDILSEAGYATGFIGKWHLDGGIPEVQPGGWIPPERRRGWQEWHGYEKSHEFFKVWRYNDRREKVRVEGHDWEPAWQTDVALDFARRHTETGRPWAYYLAYGPPHFPRQCPEKYLAMFPPEKFRMPDNVKDTPEARKEYQMYYAQCYSLDVEVGRIVKGLEKIGAADSTIVVYTSDHGDFLGADGHKLRGKAKPHPNAFRIPMIVRWPRGIPARQVSDALFGSVDLAPTLLAMAGLPVPAAMQGLDMSLWCRGREGPGREWLYMGLGSPERGGFWRAAWNGREVAHSGAPVLALAEELDDPALPRLRQKS